MCVSLDRKCRSENVYSCFRKSSYLSHFLLFLLFFSNIIRLFTGPCQYTCYLLIHVKRRYWVINVCLYFQSVYTSVFIREFFSLCMTKFTVSTFAYVHVLQKAFFLTMKSDLNVHALNNLHRVVNRFP